MTVAEETIAGLLRARADAAPDGEGLVHAGGVWTWGEYWQRASAAGAGLRAAGLSAGDHLVVLVGEPHETVALLFGAWAIGAVPILTGEPYRLADRAAFVAQLRRLARRLDARAVVVPDGFADAGTAAARGGGKAGLAARGSGRDGDGDGLAARDGDGDRRAVSGDADPAVIAAAAVLDGDGGAVGPAPPRAPAFIQLTSGSTGDPRGAVIAHAALLDHLAAISAALPLAGDGARCVTWLPLHHDMGLVGGLLYPLYNGFPVHLLSPAAFRADPFAWLQTLSDARATCTPAPPSAYALAARLAPKAQRAGLDLSALRCAMIGAEPIAPAVLRAFAAGFGPCGFRAEAFFCVYGLAEATVAVTFPDLLAPAVVDRVDRATLERDGRAQPCDGGAGAIEYVGVGRPLPGTEIMLVRADGMPAGEREVGEIHVRAASLMDGYYGDPRATAEAIAGGWLKTGDLGYEAGGNLFVTGRLKDLIIRGGHNLLPAPIEAIAGAVDGIRAGCVAAVGVPSARRATELVYVVCETSAAADERPALARRVREALRVHAITVDHVVLVDPASLPRTTSGKLRRREVARLVGDEHVGDRRRS